MANVLDPYALKLMKEARAHLQRPADLFSDFDASPVSSVADSSLPELFDDGTVGAPNKNYYPVLFDALRPRDHLGSPLLWCTPTGYESSLTPWYTIAALNALRLQAQQHDEAEPTWTHSFYQKLYSNEPQRFPRLASQGFVLRYEDTLLYRNPRGASAPVTELPANVVAFDEALCLALSHVRTWMVPGKKWFQDQWPERKELWQATPIPDVERLHPALPTIARCLAEAFFGTYRPAAVPLAFRRADDASWRWTPEETHARAWPMLIPLLSAPLPAPPPPMLLEVLYALRHPRRWLFLPARFHHAFHFCLQTPAGSRLQGTLFAYPDALTSAEPATMTWHAVDQFDAHGAPQTSVLHIQFANLHIDNLCVVPALMSPAPSIQQASSATTASTAFLPPACPFVPTVGYEQKVRPGRAFAPPAPPPNPSDRPHDSSAAANWSFLDSLQ